MPHRAEQPDSVDRARPEWFAAFLADRGTRKPSAHTLKAYRQDFDAIAALIAGGEDRSGMALDTITIDTLRTAFARYAQSHQATSIQRCWSTWNVLCTFLFTAELIASNPMPMVGRPKLAKTLPKALAADAVAALLTALSADPSPRRRTDWMQRDRALILTALLAGLRADELVRANVGDLRRTDDGAVIHVRGKGGKDRRIPIEPALVDILERYLDTRAARFPAAAKRHSSPGRGLAAWPAAAPLFVGADGERITRGTLQYRVLRVRQCTRQEHRQDRRGTQTAHPGLLRAAATGTSAPWPPAERREHPGHNTRAAATRGQSSGVLIAHGGLRCGMTESLHQLGETGAGGSGQHSP